MAEESQLIKEAVKGDREALEQLLTANYNYLLGYTVKLVMNQSIAEDIVQETMVKAILHIKGYKPMGKFLTWLIAIANNLYRDYLRKNKKQNFGELEDVAAKEDLEEMVLDKLDIEKVHKLLGTLPLEKRMVVILKHYYGYKYEEISEILNCPVGTVRSRLHDGIKSLRSKLYKAGNAREDKNE